MPENKNIADMLDLLRCPVGVHMKDKGSDPGKLRIVKDVWLVCDDSGCKYPVVDGIPRMLVEIGEKYKNVAEDDLPIPPPES